MADDPLDDFTLDSFAADGTTHPVYRSGEGPAVLVIAEIPGITPKVVDFARMVRDAGFTVVLPHLFGTPGRDPNPPAHGWTGTVATAAKAFGRVCVSREFSLFATGQTSPVVSWLRALAAQEHERCGGPGVGAVGMCLTGGFALAMATDERMLAPVLSQPSLPLSVLPGRRHGTDISPEDLAVVKQRCVAGELKVMGLRFRSDRLVTGERFDWLREQLGDAFVAVEMDDEDANPEGTIAPHSVLTEHLVDEPGSRTRAALDDVLDLFRSRLLPEQPSDVAERIAAWLEELDLADHLAAAGLPSYSRDAQGRATWTDPNTGEPLSLEQLQQLDGLLHDEGDDPEYAVPVALVQIAQRARVRKVLLASPVHDYESLAGLRGASVNATRFAVHKAAQAHEMLVLATDERTLVPAFQVTGTGEVRPEIVVLLQPLLAAGMDPWNAWAWLTQPAALLGGQVPEQAAADPEEADLVRHAAVRLAERVAAS